LQFASLRTSIQSIYLWQAFFHAAMKAAILLIDDYPEIRDSLDDILRGEGYDVILASNGTEALNALRDTSFDLVLLNLDMRLLNGWDTFVKIVTVSLSLPVIIITDRTDQKWLAAQKGVAAVLEKPWNLNLLLEAMGRTLATSAGMRRRQIETSRIPSAP
jgi:DNA-binding NtrC family response regulator